MAASSPASGALLRPPLRAIVVILVLGFALRGGALLLAGDMRPVHDERNYLLRAHALLDGKGYVGSYQSWVNHPEVPGLANLPQYPGAFQPPGYPGFIAAVLAVTGRSPLAVKWTQVLLGAASLAVLYAIGTAWFDRRTGLVAAALAAVYPNLIAFTHYFWSETLFIILLTLALWLLTKREGPPTPAAAASAGLLLGAGCLTRTALAYFVPLLLAWLVLSRRREAALAARRAALVVIVAAVVIVPWSVRNTALHGGFVFIDTNGPFNFWRGNAPTSFQVRRNHPRGNYRPPFAAIPLMPVSEQNARVLTAVCRESLGNPKPTDLEIVRCGGRLAREQIARHPGVFLSRVPIRLFDMWNPTSFLVRHFRFGAYGDVSRFVEAGIGWLAMASYVAVVLLAIPAALRRWRDAHVALVVMMTAYFFAIHAITFGLSRFRLPLLPFFMLLAALTLQELWSRSRGRPPRVPVTSEEPAGA